MIRLVGLHGWTCAVHDANGTGAQRRGDSGLLDLLKKAVVQLAVGLDFALENVVADRFHGMLGDDLRLPGVVIGEQRFPAQGRLVVVANSLDDGAAFVLDRRLHLVDLRGETFDLMMGRREGRIQFRVLPFQVREAKLVLPQRPRVENGG